jgi:hypothetical protein
MRMDEELETRMIIFPLGRVEGPFTTGGRGRGGGEGGGEIVGDGRLEAVPCDHLILTFYQSVARS